MIGSPTWIDEVLSDSFPASDPPSWIPGVVRPAPAGPDPGGVTADGLEDEIGIDGERPAARVRANANYLQVLQLWKRGV